MGVSYEVIGVMAKRKGQLMKDQAADKAILVPYRTYQKHRPGDDENLIGAVAYPGRMPEAEDEIRRCAAAAAQCSVQQCRTILESPARRRLPTNFAQITASVAAADFGGEFHWGCWWVESA